jgi:hypothetical protein
MWQEVAQVTATELGQQVEQGLGWRVVQGWLEE